MRAGGRRVEQIFGPADRGGRAGAGRKAEWKEIVSALKSGGKAALAAVPAPRHAARGRAHREISQVRSRTTVGLTTPRSPHTLLLVPRLDRLGAWHGASRRIWLLAV